MAQMQELTKNQLDRIQLTPESTVLDVGGGAGRLTIPLAKRVKHVTALEPSPKMFDILNSNIKEKNLHNVTTINRCCEDLVSENFVQPHDIVVSSFSLFMVDVGNVLQKLDKLANKAVYLFVFASQWMNDELQKIVNGDITPITSSDHIYIYNILHDLGILANVEIWSSESRHCYQNLDEAATKFSEKYGVADKKEEIRAYLDGRMIKENGKLVHKPERKTAMVWWTKT